MPKLKYEIKPRKNGGYAVYVNGDKFDLWFDTKEQALDFIKNTSTAKTIDITEALFGKDWRGI